MSGTVKRTLQLVLSVVIGGACLYFALRDVPFQETKALLFATELWGVAVATVLMLLQLVVRTRRWMLQVEGLRGKPIAFREAVAICSVSFVSVFLLPFRLGELVRPYLSSQRGLMSTSAGIANSAVERVVDGMVTTACFGVVLVLIGDSAALPDEVALGGWGALAVFGGAAVVLVGGVKWRGPSLRFWRAVLSKIHERLATVLVGLLEAFLDGLGCFRSWRDVVMYFVYSAAFWGLNGLAMWVLMLALGIEVGLAAAYFTVCFMVIAVMIPAPPGNLGNFHYFAKLALVLVGVGEVPALAFAVLAHAWHTAAYVVFAVPFLLLGDVSLARIREAAASEADASPEAASPEAASPA